MKHYLLAPLFLASWTACRTVLPGAAPGGRPFTPHSMHNHLEDAPRLLWLGAGLALGLCLAWLFRRFLLRKGTKGRRAGAGPEVLELAQRAQDSTEEILRSLPRKNVVVDLARRRKGKKGKRL